MKTVLSIGFFLIGMIGWSQSNSIILGLPNDSLIITNLDTISVEGDPYDNIDYKIDLDNNGVWDLKLSFWIAGGGGGWSVIDFLKSQDSTFILSDTVQVQEIGYCNDLYWDTIKLTCPIRYDSGQLFQGLGWMAYSTHLIKTSWTTEPCFIGWDVVHWRDNQIHYAGFIKFINGQKHLGWLKMRLPYNAFVILYEWAIQNYAVAIPEQEIPVNEILSISYYNLLGQEIAKPRHGFYIERQVTNKGIISKKYFIP